MPEWKQEIRERLTPLNLAPTREAEIVEEFSQHLEDRYAELLAGGATEEEAARVALAGLSESELLEHELRRVERQFAPEPVALGTNRRANMLTDLWQDLRFGARMLLKQPGFTLIAVITLSLGIGANTAIFSVVNALLLRPLPFVESERLVLLSEKSRTGERLDASYPNFVDWRARAQSFEGMAASHPRSFILTGEDKAARMRGRSVNWNFFQLLGVRPQRGRLFAEADDRYGSARTVIVSHSFWQGRFGGDANVIGKTLRLTGETYTVIGVLPPGFEYFAAPDVYTPLNLFVVPDSAFADRGSSASDFFAVARLKPGVTLQQANSEMDALGRRLAQEYPKVNEGKSAMAERLQDVMSEGVRQSLWVLLAAVGIYGVIAYTVRQRTHELGIRMALGAQAGDALRLILGQGLKLALIGVALGLAVALALTRWMESLLFEVRPADPLTFCLLAVVLLCVALVACWVPARRATQVDPLLALRSE